MQILYNTNSISDILTDNSDTSMVEYDKISNSVTDFIVETIKSKGSSVEDKELSLEVKKFDAVLSVIFKDFKNFINKIENNMEEFKNTVIRNSNLKSDDISVGIKEELRQNTYSDFLSAIVSDLFNSYVKKRYIKDSLLPNTVNVESFTFSNVICISTNVSKDVVDLTVKDNRGTPLFDMISDNLMEMFSYINKRPSTKNDEIYKMRDFYRFCKNVSIEIPETDNIACYDIIVNLTYNFATMLNNLINLVNSKVEGLESWEFEDVFPLNENYVYKRSVESSDNKFVKTNLPFFSPEEIVVKASEFVPAIIQSVSEMFKNSKVEDREACIRKVTPYILGLKDKIGQAFDKIIKINAGLQQYYKDRYDLINADISFGSRKNPVTGSIEKIETIEDFINKFIYFVYESYQKKNSKPITFYFDMNITLDIPRKETDKYYIELFNGMSNIIKPLFPDFSKKNVTAIKHYRKQDATVYELVYKLEFTDHDYVELFREAKKISEQERSSKGLENY